MQKIKISKKELCELYIKKKLTTYQISKRFNCCQATIWKLLHKFGIKSRLSGYPRVKISKKELEELYLKQRLSSRKIAKRYDCAYSTVDRNIRRYGFKIRTLAEANRKYPKKDFDGCLLEKSYLIGFRIGDLRVRKQYKNGETIQVDCASTKIAQINLIKDLFDKYGRVGMSKPSKKGKIHVHANLNLSFGFLLNKKFYKWIQNNKQYFAAFLAGFTDAEGSIFISKNQAKYALGNYDMPLLHLICKGLNKFGIECREPTVDKSKGYISKEGYVRRNNYSSLTISKKKALLKLFDLIEPYIKHADKKEAIKKAKVNICLRNQQFGNINM